MKSPLLKNPVLIPNLDEYLDGINLVGYETKSRTQDNFGNFSHFGRQSAVDDFVEDIYQQKVNQFPAQQGIGHPPSYNSQYAQAVCGRNGNYGGFQHNTSNRELTFYHPYRQGNAQDNSEYHSTVTTLPNSLYKLTIDDTKTQVQSYNNSIPILDVEEVKEYAPVDHQHFDGNASNIFENFSEYPIETLQSNPSLPQYELFSSPVVKQEVDQNLFLDQGSIQHMVKESIGEKIRKYHKKSEEEKASLAYKLKCAKGRDAVRRHRLRDKARQEAMKSNLNQLKKDRDALLQIIYHYRTFQGIYHPALPQLSEISDE